MIDQKLSLALVLVTLFACTSLAKVQSREGSEVPDEVFVGTDYALLADFVSVPITASALEGVFRIETGGAAQTVKLIHINGNRWQVTRVIIEPGESPFERTYLAELVDGVLVDSDGVMKLRALSDGILLLETSDEIVPADVWTFYKRSL